MAIRQERIDIGRIIAPQSVALIGATDDYGKFGGRILHHLVEMGYEGRIFPINPRRDSVRGIPCFGSVEDVPQAPDIALVALPAHQLPDTIAACGRAGVGACIVITAQMAEFGPEGAALEARITAIAQAHNMRIVGPNCMGFIVPAARLALSSTPTLRYAGSFRHGGVALVSQSGALMGSLFVQAHDHGVGLSGMVSIGNQADLELCDFVEGFLDRDDTNVICMYVEGVASPARLRALGLRARAEGKALVAVKAGRTDAGSTMARSHTSSLAGSYSAFETLCRECGILLMDDPEAMIVSAGILSANPMMGVGGISVVCSSGGGGAVLADRMSLAGIPVAEYTEATRTALSTDFQTAHQNNPLDLGAHIGALSFDIFRRSIEAVHADANTGALVYVMTPQPMMPETLDCVIALWQQHAKPVVLVLNTSRFADALRQRALEVGLPVVTRTDDALRVLSLLVARRDADAGMRPDRPARPEGLALATASRTGFLTEPEAKALMAGYAIPVPGAETCASVEAAIAAGERIGYPLVLKGVVADIVHKSDLGLVKVGIRDAADLRDAYASIAASITAAAPGASIVIDVQQMIPPGQELIVGVTNDALSGPQIIVGAGGVYVELLHDIAQSAAPVSEAEAGAMLRRLRIWPLMDGARGQATLDTGAAARAISRLSWLAHDLGDRLVDFEVNPLRVTPAGAWALDGRGTID